MCENVNLPSRAPVVASPEGLTGSTTQVYKMDEICEQCRIQLMLRQRRYMYRLSLFPSLIVTFNKILLRGICTPNVYFLPCFYEWR